MLLLLQILAGCVVIFLASWFTKLVCETISFYFLNPRYIKKVMAKQGVYGPTPRPLTGNLTDISSLVSSTTSTPMPYIHHDIVGRLLPHHCLWSNKYGGRYIYWHGFEPRMCVTDTALIMEFLKKYNLISGRSWLQQQGSKNFIGGGLLMANGDDWRYQRHLVAQAFRRDKLKSYCDKLVVCTRKMLQTMHRKVKSGDREVEISEYMTHLTANIISKILFGSNDEEGKMIFNHLTRVQILSAQASKHLCMPGSRFFPSKYNKEIRSLKASMETLLMEIIRGRVKESVEKSSDSPPYGNDMLGMMLDEIMKKKKSTGGGGYHTKDGFDVDKRLVIDECKTFFFAGHETTFLMLTWTIMLLAINPEWQDKVRKEVAQVCNGSTPSVGHLSRLFVLNRVIHESLRLYPTATVLPRMMFQDTILGDLRIPKGLSIWIPVLAIHHSHELWGPDADEFNPDRFTYEPFVSSKFIPFGAGARSCIGQSFALIEAKIVLAMLVSQFRFTISSAYHHAPITVMTIKPKHGVQIYLKPL